VEFAVRNDILICHDNPYCDVVFGDHVPPSVLQVPGAMDVAIEFNSLSKTYNMAGWRVGMAVGNPIAVEALSRIKTNIDSGIFRPVQDAAVAALTGDLGWLGERNDIYRQRRDLILDGLREVGIRTNRPSASLYVWAATPANYSSHNFANLLLDEVGISLTPGSAFGPHGEGYLRVSLGCDTDRIREAMKRLKQMVW
jgi:LL-diaminopimelate aminotransferase